MCKYKSPFSIITNGEPARLNFAVNAHSSAIKGNGLINTSLISNEQTKILRLDNTLYVPELRTNQLSVSKATDKGYKDIFDKNAARVLNKRTGKIELVARRENNLYCLRGNNIDECKNVIEKGAIPKKGSSYDWHVRLGHLNVQDLLKAARYGCLRGLHIKNPRQEFQCQACIQGKMRRAPFRKALNRDTVPGEVIHTEVCGPMRTTSIGDNR